MVTAAVGWAKPESAPPVDFDETMSENSASDGTFDQSASVPPKPSREGGNNGQGEANDSQNYLFAHDQDRSPEESPRSGGDVHPAPSHSLRSGDSARRRTIDDSAAVDKDARPDQAGNSPTISDQRSGNGPVATLLRATVVLTMSQ